MILDTVVLPGAVNILSSFLYDASKSILGHFTNTRKQVEKKFRKDVEKWLENDVPQSMDCLVSSKEFLSFLQSAQVKDSICGYVKYVVTGSVLEDIGERTAFRTKTSIREERADVTSYLSKQFMRIYPSIDFDEEAMDFFALFLDFISNNFLKKLSNEQKALVYLINKNSMKIANATNSRLDEINQTLKSMVSHNIVKDVAEFSHTKDKYQKILKERYSQAHIYLLDSFKFDKFYVRPDLVRNKGLTDRYVANDIDFLIINEKIDMNKFCRNRGDIEALYGEDKIDNKGYSRWKYLFDYSNFVYVTGGAGYGKSLFLRNIILNYSEMNIPSPEEYLIIYCDLKTFFSQKDGRQKSVVEFMQDSMVSDTGLSRAQLSEGFIKHHLDLGRCIVLLDALDEVAKERREDLHSTIIAYFKNLNPNNKVCITSRDRGFVPQKEIEWFSITSLDSYQIELYVDRIIALGKFRKEDKESFLEQSHALIKKKFLSSFLILSLLISIYKAELELPENKLELYEKCFEYIAHKREREKIQSQFNWARIGPLMKDNTFMELSNLGVPNNKDINKRVIVDYLGKMYSEKYDNCADAEDAIEEFLRFCSDRTELFVPSAVEDHFKFFHRSFFEYFYAQFVFLRSETSREILDRMMQFDIDSEVFELVTAMLKQKNETRYKEVVSLLFEQSKNSMKLFNVLTVAMQVIDDRQFVHQYVKLCINKKKFLVLNCEKIANQQTIVEVVNRSQIAREEFLESYFPYAVIEFLYSFNLQEILWFKKRSSDNLNHENLDQERYFHAMRSHFSRKYPFYLEQTLLDKAKRQRLFEVLTMPTNQFSKWFKENGIDGRKLSKSVRLKEKFSQLNDEKMSTIHSVIDDVFARGNVGEWLQV